MAVKLLKVLIRLFARRTAIFEVAKQEFVNVCHPKQFEMLLAFILLFCEITKLWLTQLTSKI